MGEPNIEPAPTLDRSGADGGGVGSATEPAPREASWADTLRLLRDVLGPTIAKGIFMRRYAVVALAVRARLDRRAVRRMTALRARYGPGPLLLPVPGPKQAVLLEHAHVAPILNGAPEPWMPATDEKRAALAHFEPEVALASRGGTRERRRALNDRALESDNPVHSCAERFAGVAGEEIGALPERHDPLDWEAFLPAWMRMVRRIVLGDGARDDEELTDRLATLRRAGNWAMLRPRRERTLREFQMRLADHLARAEPGSLAAMLAARGGRDALERGDGPGGEAADQVTHWLFAFDPGGMATFRALALLAAHPSEQDATRAEIEGSEPPGPDSRLRATMLESLRLWPTTPAILREAARDLHHEASAVVPGGTNLTIFAPYHHRAHGQPHADTFEPGFWLEGAADGPGATDTACRHAGSGIVPFSSGPAACPARHLVPMVGAMALRALLRGRTVRGAGGAALDPSRPLPATLDNSALAFRFE